MQEKITSQQLGMMAMLYLLGSGLAFLPVSSAGRDAWAATILASLVSFFILAVLIKLQTMFPGLSLIQVGELALGRWPGKILAALFVVDLFIFFLVAAHDLVLLLRVFYPLVGRLNLTAVIIFASVYVVYKGINPIARVGQVLAWVAIVFTLLALTLTSTRFNLQNLTPFLADFRPILAGGIAGAAGPHSEIILLALFLPLVSDLGQRRKTVYLWYFVAVLFILARSWLVVGTLGAEGTALSRFPLLEGYRLVTLSNFQRVELFFFILWFSTSFFAVVLGGTAILLSLQQLFNLKDYRATLFPAALCALSLGLYFIPSDIFFFDMVISSEALLVLPFNLFYPSLVLLAGWLYLRRHPRFRPSTPMKGAPGR